ncbi:hypothetical protein [Halococcus thailandensis]|uniref:hypothetical protein n=1 Tax=Halococcus thailandensis TaxID=335952 RepID=UPI000AD0AD11|nr:hypothetical protein [Halococcus thailandensis]
MTETEPTGDDADSDAIDPETLDYLTERLAAIDTELAALRNDKRRSEAELRALIRDEVREVLGSDD